MRVDEAPLHPEQERVDEGTHQPEDEGSHDDLRRIEVRSCLHDQVAEPGIRPDELGAHDDEEGQAEAESMRKKAEAWRTYNEAAIAQMFIEKLPELARAIAEPLGRTDKITIISNGAEGAGSSKLTKDVIDIIAQLPPVLEGVSGINLKELIGKIPGATAKK